jgi:hypothetical protein
MFVTNASFAAEVQRFLGRRGFPFFDIDLPRQWGCFLPFRLTSALKEAVVRHVR